MGRDVSGHHTDPKRKLQMIFQLQARSSATGEVLVEICRNRMYLEYIYIYVEIRIIVIDCMYT